MSSGPYQPIPDFLTQGDALNWHPTLVGVHVLADVIIAAACFTLALTLVRLARAQSQPAGPRSLVFSFVAAFLVSSGLAHATEVVTMWLPEYGVSGIAKSATALFAMGAAWTLLRSPSAFAQRSSRAAAQQEESTIEERITARTTELTAANVQLRREAAEREQAEAELIRLNMALQA